MHVNPFRFILDNFMRNNTYIITLKVDQMPEEAPGTAGFEFLREFLPPQTSYLLFIEMPQVDEYYGTDNASDQLEFGQGLNMVESYQSVLDKGPRIRAVEDCV